MFVIELIVQHFAVADDGVQWGTQLVAYVGKKTALGVIGAVGVIFSLAHLQNSIAQF